MKFTSQVGQDERVRRIMLENGYVPIPEGQINSIAYGMEDWFIHKNNIQ